MHLLGELRPARCLGLPACRYFHARRREPQIKLPTTAAGRFSSPAPSSSRPWKHPVGSQKAPETSDLAVKSPCPPQAWLMGPRPSADTSLPREKKEEVHLVGGGVNFVPPKEAEVLTTPLPLVNVTF